MAVSCGKPSTNLPSGDVFFCTTRTRDLGGVVQCLPQVMLSLEAKACFVLMTLRDSQMNSERNRSEAA